MPHKVYDITASGRIRLEPLSELFVCYGQPFVGCRVDRDDKASLGTKLRDGQFMRLILRSVTSEEIMDCRLAFTHPVFASINYIQVYFRQR